MIGKLHVVERSGSDANVAAQPSALVTLMILSELMR
jgi:hypothetical protein